MGLAIHPEFGNGKPYVYLAYVYRQLAEQRFLGKLVRYSYDQKKQTLIEPQELCDTIPASNDHNGGRLLIAPVGDQMFLFYAVGDQGAGQFSNGGRPNQAQNPKSYEGKILRYLLEPSPGGSWIPDDNPMGNRASAVFSTGHRNLQGLAYANINGTAKIYSTEHGPYGDDEINLIEKGKNYGHPLVIGYPDGNYDGLAASVSNNTNYPGKWHTTYPYISSEKGNADSIGKTYRAPLKSLHPASNQHLTALFHKIAAGQQVDWPAYAPSGIAVYHSAAIPGWKNSLLITSLKTGKLLRIKINPDGSLADSVYTYAASRARYRDVAISADGRKIYLATDSSAITSGPTAENPKSTSQRGAIIELSFRKKS